MRPICCHKLEELYINWWGTTINSSINTKIMLMVRTYRIVYIMWPYVSHPHKGLTLILSIMLFTCKIENNEFWICFLTSHFSHAILLLYNICPGTDTTLHNLDHSTSQECVWHLFLWAVLGNRIDLADFFLIRTTCKLGAALLAYRLLKNLSKKALRLNEVELSSNLMDNAQ